MILIKKRISIFFCCLFLFCCSFSATFASELVFNSTFSSGESITIGGEVLTLTLNFKNFDVLIKSETGDAHILEFFGSKLIGNYVFVHGGTILVDTETFKDPYVGSPISPQARRVKLEVYTYEPTLSSNWTISENAVLVGEEVEFVLTLLNTYDAPAEDVSFIHELPASFVLSDIDDCEFSNGVISAVMNLDEDEDHLCTYSGFFTKSFEKTELVSKLSLETLLHNVSFSPDALELTVNDPFKFELDSKTHLNRTEPFDISFKFESTEPSEIIVHDFSVYVPTDFISVEGTTIPLWRGESDLPFGTTYEYESFYKRVSKMTTKGDKLSLNMSLRADVFEYIPLYYSYSYTFDDVMYDSGLKAKYLNISRVGLTDEPVLEYTFSLSDISVDTLKTNSTKNENVYVEVTNWCNCLIENITVEGTLFNKTIFSHYEKDLFAGNTFFLQHADNYMPFVEGDTLVPFTGYISYYFEGEPFVIFMEEDILVQAAKTTSFTSKLSDSKVEVSQPVDVSIIVESGFHGANLSIFAWENESYLLENFFILGPVERKMSGVPNEKESVYSYRLIPKQVETEITYTFNTGYSYSYHSLFLFNQLHFNDSFDENNEAHLAWFNKTVVQNDSYTQRGEIVKSLTVIPRTKGLILEHVTGDETLNEGDTVTVEFSVSNNGTDEITDILLSPLTSRYFQSKNVKPIYFTRLLPDEKRIVEFTYRILSDDEGAFENTSLVQTSYTTPEHVTIQSDVMTFDELTVFSTKGILRPLLEKTVNVTSNESTLLLTYEGEGHLDIRQYYVNGSSTDRTLNLNMPLLLSDEETGKTSSIVQLVGGVEFEIQEFISFVKGTASSQQKTPNDLGENDTVGTQSEIVLLGDQNGLNVGQFIRISLIVLLIGLLLAGIFFFIQKKGFNVAYFKKHTRSEKNMASPILPIVQKSLGPTKPVVISTPVSHKSIDSPSLLKKKSLADIGGKLAFHKNTLADLKKDILKSDEK